MNGYPSGSNTIVVAALTVCGINQFAENATGKLFALGFVKQYSSNNKRVKPCKQLAN
jgi:hypothetical protein